MTQASSHTPQTDQASPQPEADHPQAGPVSQLQNDRFCRHCGFNLCGQPITREPYYRLLIINCPQCNTTTPVQEYPGTGPWAARWRSVAAAIWFLILAIFTIGAGGAAFGACFGVAGESAWGFRWHLQDQFQVWLDEQPDITGDKFYYLHQDRFADWHADQSIDQIVANAGGFWSVIHMETVAMGILPIAGAFILGALWSLALLGTTTKGRVLFCSLHFLIPFIIAIAIMSIVFALTDPDPETLAIRYITTSILIPLLLLCTLAVIAGTLLGRRLTRKLITALLPPKGRFALSFLWRADGLDLPTRSNT